MWQLQFEPVIVTCLLLMPLLVIITINLEWQINLGNATESKFLKIHNSTNSPDTTKMAPWRSESIPSYNSSTDLVYFYHPMKTGGTSLSLLIEALAGRRHVLPGSAFSSFFNTSELTKALSGTKDANKTLKTQTGLIGTYKFGYSHTHYLKFERDLEKILVPSEQKLSIRVMSMFRDPVTLRASHFYEWICHVKHSHTQYQYEAAQGMFGDIAKGSDPCAVNLTYIVEARVASGGSKFSICRDPEIFVSSAFYKKQMSNLLHDTISGVCDGFEDCYETARTAISDTFLWFGITERMEESMCLFFYTLKLKWQKIGSARLKECRPLDIWSDKAQKTCRQMEKLDYEIFRAANDVMDARLHAMHTEINEMSKNGIDLASLPYLHPSCLDAMIFK